MRILCSNDDGIHAKGLEILEDIAAALGADGALPTDADVANAVGAVAGGVRLSVQAGLTQPADGVIRAHLPDGTEDHPTVEAARAATSAYLRIHAADLARIAGADDPELTETWDERSATVENQKVFVEATLTVVATGRPRVAG